MSEGSSTSGSRKLSWWWLAVLFAAVLPSAGTLSAPLISDDGAILGYVAENGALSDWTTSQYDLRSVRFWRPLVTTSFAVQEALTGVESLPLRLFNLLGHAASALLLGLLATRLGAGRLGALLAGLLCAWFPEQGGNVTWIAGRVDSQCVPFILLACLLALDDRRILALVAGFLALGAKELAVVIPLWIALLAWGRGDSLGAAIRRALPLAGVVLLVGIWRRLALGTWVGGYPSQGLSADRLEALANSATAFGAALAPELIAIAVVLLLTRSTGWAKRTLALVGCSIVAAAPLLHLLSGGSVPLEHARTLWLADAALALALGSSFGAQAPSLSKLRRNLGVLGLVAVMVLAAHRGELARIDVLDWSKGAEQAEREVQAVRDELAQENESLAPVVSSNFTRITESGAYVLHWGIADRFRAPFEKSARPVWPWRPVIEVAGPNTFRELLFEIAGGVGYPIDERGRQAAKLEVRRADGEPLGVLSVLSSFAIQGAELDPSPRLAAQLDPALASPAAWELLFICELGYRVVRLDTPSRELKLSVREALLAVEDVFLLAVDFRAERGFLELRAVAGDGEVLASSSWIELAWEREELLSAE